MLSASEAAELSRDITSGKGIEKFLARIERDIKTAINAGEKKCVMRPSCATTEGQRTANATANATANQISGIIKRLRDLGYEVRPSQHRQDTYYMIHW